MSAVDCARIHIQTKSTFISIGQSPSCQVCPKFSRDLSTSNSWSFASKTRFFLIANIILANFWKVEVGTLEIGCHIVIKTTVIAKRSLRGRSRRFLGGPGACSPEILKIETVKYAFFNVLANDSTHLLQEKLAWIFTKFLAFRGK